MTERIDARNTQLTRRNLFKLGLLSGGAVAFAQACDVAEIFKALNVSAGVPANPDASASAAPSASAEASPSASAEPSASSEASDSLITPASKDAKGDWTITDPEGNSESIPVIEGFTPDSHLVTAPEWGGALKLDPKRFADFQPSLNNPDHPLVGYSYGENDQSDNTDYRRTLQAPMFSWTVMTGEEVEAPGIGHLKGANGRAVELMIMNIDASVGDFGPDNPVLIKHGFTGAGRIWNGDEPVPAEQGISSHYVSRLQEGVTLPGEGGFIGQCDLPGNCNEVLVVSVIRRQWGENPDGTKRFQYQLLREEIVKK